MIYSVIKKRGVEMVGHRVGKGKGGGRYLLLVYESLVAEGDEKWKV